MTAYPTTTLCARCGALETSHELRTDGRTRGKRLGQAAGDDGNVRCEGFVAGAVVELVPERELRRRLGAVLALHHESTLMPGNFVTGTCVDQCSCGWQGQPRKPGEPFERCPTVRAARGEA